MVVRAHISMRMRLETSSVILLRWRNPAHIASGSEPKLSPTKGIFQLSINGVKQGFTVDEYSPTVAYGVQDLVILCFLTPETKRSLLQLMGTM